MLVVTFIWILAVWLFNQCVMIYRGCHWLETVPYLSQPWTQEKSIQICTPTLRGRCA